MGVHIEEWTKVKGKADEAKIFKKKKTAFRKFNKNYQPNTKTYKL